MSSTWVVLKFGGTSVAGRPQWEAIAAQAQRRLSQGHRVLLVCSAVSGVTNALTELAASPESEKTLAWILERHCQLGRELCVPESEWLETAEKALRQCTSALIEDHNIQIQAELLALGEWLSTRIGTAFLQQFTEADWVDVRQALKVVNDPELSPARQCLSASCEPGPDTELAEQWQKLAPLVVTQGYIAATHDGHTALLGRGGSDTSAALLAGRLGACELEIWTDVPGLFSADPRLLPQARLLSNLGYEEALEMAIGGARVVHPRCIRAAATTGTPLLILDTSRPQLRGTRIAALDEAGQSAAADGVKAVTCKKDMLVLLLQNIDTRHEVGFLARVFEVFRLQGISVDLVATSETTTTVAVHGPSNYLDAAGLEALLAKLRVHCLVQVHADCVCINLVGSSVRTALGRLQTTGEYFAGHPLLMLSQSANDRCLSLLVNASDHEDLLRLLHQALIPGSSNGVFGASWQEIQAS
jgi:diaminopimelate decarboxylase/aspartate kinase